MSHAQGGHVFHWTAPIFKLNPDIIRINVLTNEFTRKNAPLPGGHVLQQTRTIFELIGQQMWPLRVLTRKNARPPDIIGTNLLTKFHEDRTVNFYYSHIRKYAPPLGSHFFQANIIIFELIQDIIETNLLTEFHEDWTINVASREKCPAPGGHVFKATKTIFELIQDIIGTNLLTKFHDDRKINVTSRVLTRKIAPPPWWPYIIGMNLLTEKNAPPLGGHVFQANVTIFKLIQDIIYANLLTIFHQDWTINVGPLEKNAPPPGGYVFQPTGIIFDLVQDIIGMNLLTKFHEDWTINVALEKNAPPLGSHVFQAKVTIFELIQYISGTNLLSKFHEDRKINVASRMLTRKNALPPGGHVFQPTGIIFEHVKFYEDQTINVASREKSPAPWQPCFLSKHIIETNLLTKVHEDLTINVASRELTREMLTPHNGQRTTDKKRSQASP
ncbi:hypothetical protein DPMN_183137 [Dreissena polymorpha]|uniref:Uncharacterized protein n=1 Tax=Dreissena polymorpha TaxID=45954 RepID=A0A9D4I638_DREPO|nr:hypothetical protein DPMN_183137 [Dreissena polymorpha]